MAAVLKTVLIKGDKMGEVIDSYVDDIIIDVMKVLTKEVIDHLKEFELTTKPPEHLEEGVALGLKLKKRKNSELVFERGNEILQVTGGMNWWESFSVPVLSWVISIVEESRRIRTKGAGEMIIKWELEIL